VCGSVLFASVALFGKGGTDGDHRAQGGTVKEAGDVEATEKSGRKAAAGGRGEGGPADAGDERLPARPGTIRLSGIHKPSQGNLGLIVPAQDRSDLDLWMDNPVEADAKWKGKVVEVEMNLDD